MILSIPSNTDELLSQYLHIAEALLGTTCRLAIAVLVSLYFLAYYVHVLLLDMAVYSYYCHCGCHRLHL